MLGRGCLHDPLPTPPPGTGSLMSFPGWQHFTHVVTFSAGVIKQELSHLCDFTGGGGGSGTWTFPSGVLWTLPRAPFPFADCAVNPFTTVNP